MKKNVWWIAAMAFAFSSQTNAQSVCMKSGCTNEEFFHETMWTGKQFLEADRPSVDSTHLRACLALTTLKAAQAIFKDKTYFSADQFKANLTMNVKSAPQWYKNCESHMTWDQYTEVLSVLMVSTRQKTQFTSLLANPKSYKTKTLRVDGIGEYVLGTLYLRRSQGDMNPVIVDFTSQTQVEREKVIGQCGSVSSSCNLTVSGLVIETEPIIAISTEGESIEFRKQ